MNREKAENEVGIILKTPKVFIVTAIFLLVCYYFIFDKIIYKTKIDNLVSTIELNEKTIKTLKEDIKDLKTKKDTIKIIDTITIEKEIIKHVSTPRDKPINSQTSQNAGSGSIITQNQSGGVNIGTIKNESPQRKMNKMIGDNIKSIVPAGKQVDIVCVNCDGEANKFAAQIRQWLNNNGYKSSFGTIMSSSQFFGQRIDTSNGMFKLYIGLLKD